MASKNLGAVIQRAISDGAFRRQLQSDPAAALRGFNLTPDEVAAIRSGDSGKLMSLGVDQRMSKAFSVFGGTGASARNTLADGTASAGSSALIDSGNAGIREGIVGDPTGNSRSAFDPVSGVGREAFSPGDTASTSDALTTGNTSGTRALHEDAPSDTGLTLNDPTAAGTRAINNTEPGIGNQDAVASTGDLATRSVNDVAPFDGSVRASAGDGELATRQVHDSEPSVASQMADANLADGTRALHNVEPADLGSSQVAAADNFLGSEIQPDPGTSSGHGFTPSDSADVQREMLDGTGNALGNTGDQHSLS